jgi:hypothetical protein
LPGVGRIVLATLLAEAFDALQNRDYHTLRCQSARKRGSDPNSVQIGGRLMPCSPSAGLRGDRRSPDRTSGALAASAC